MDSQVGGYTVKLMGMTDTDQLLIDARWMRRALELAREAAARAEVPVGAVIVQGGEALAEAYNLREAENDPTAHAEILALRLAAKKLNSWRLENCTLYVTLEPCPMCAGAMINARLPRVVYGATDPKMGCVETFYHLCQDTRFNHQVQATGGVLAEECGQVLKDFFRKKRGNGKNDEGRISKDE